MYKPIRKITRSTNKEHKNKNRYEHWLIDNQVYFITARCRDRFSAFAGEKAKAVFWDRFDFYTARHGFTPWVTSLLGNHYHTLGYLRVGAEFPTMMQRIHGSVAKLVNDLLPERRPKFWRDAGLPALGAGLRPRRWLDRRSPESAWRFYHARLQNTARSGKWPTGAVGWETFGRESAGSETRAQQGVPYKRYLQDSMR